VIGAGFSGGGRAGASHPQARRHARDRESSERTPDELLAKIEAGEGTMAATVDTGWWGTQG
jgi:hypothetical protein